jgi:hypothetical protein
MLTNLIIGVQIFIEFDNVKIVFLELHGIVACTHRGHFNSSRKFR